MGLSSGMTELDRVTGGGFVRGSVLLVGGDPGIGKSTLLTQATSLMARAGKSGPDVVTLGLVCACALKPAATARHIASITRAGG
jgi:replicative DNA helicase